MGQRELGVSEEISYGESRTISPLVQVSAAANGDENRLRLRVRYIARGDVERVAGFYVRAPSRLVVSRHAASPDWLLSGTQ